MPEIHFETLWIMKMTKQIWKNFLTLDILSMLQYLRGGSVPLYERQVNVKSQKFSELDIGGRETCSLLFWPYSFSFLPKVKTREMIQSSTFGNWDLLYSDIQPPLDFMIF